MVKSGFRIYPARVHYECDLAVRSKVAFDFYLTNCQSPGVHRCFFTGKAFRVDLDRRGGSW